MSVHSRERIETDPLESGETRLEEGMKLYTEKEYSALLEHLVSTNKKRMELEMVCHTWKLAAQGREDDLNELDEKLVSAEASATNMLAEFMVEQGFATGHGDSIRALLSEFSWQLAEMRSAMPK
mgnify:CR=1 FL=1